MEKMAALREKSKKNGGAYSIQDISDKKAELAIQTREKETGKKMSYDEKNREKLDAFNSIMGINVENPRDY